MAFSRDGATLAAGIITAPQTMPGSATIAHWDVRNAAAPVRAGVDIVTSNISSMAFNPANSAQLVVGINDIDTGGAQIWDVASHRQINPPLAGHASAVVSVAISPDGKTLVSGSLDGTIRLWDISVASWQARACAVVDPNLTPDEWAQFFGAAPYHKTCPKLP